MPVDIIKQSTQTADNLLILGVMQLNVFDFIVVEVEPLLILWVVGVVGVMPT
jgi:hypothetical protein